MHMTGANRLERRKITLRRMIATRFVWMFLAVSATMIGTVAFDPSQSIQATIEAVATADSVLYRADWTDVSTIDPVPVLKVEIESQFGTEAAMLTEANREGMFTSLRPNTLYRVRILRDDGFGSVVLASTSVRTTVKASGAIAVTFLRDESEPGESSLQPLIQVLFSDPLAEYAAWRIRHKVLWQPVSSEDVLEPSGYQTEPILASGDIVELYTLYPMNQMLSIYLEGQTAEGTWKTIEHRLVATPLSFHASLYLSSFFPDSVGYFAYVDDSLALGAEFWTELWRNGRQVHTQRIVPSEDSNEPGMMWYRGLTRETDYSIRLMVRYVDPNTKASVTRVLSEQTFRTPSMYRIHASATIEGNHIVLTLEVDDPKGLLTEFQYAVINHEHHEYIGGPIVLTDLGNGIKRAVVTIDFTQIGPKAVSITALLQLDSQTSVTTQLYHDIVESGGLS